MDDVHSEKLKEIGQAALNETSKGLDFLIAELMKEKKLRADQVEIVQEVTPSGIKIFVQEKTERPKNKFDLLTEGGGNP